MKNKQWFIFIFVVLLLVPMYSFATTKNANNIQNTSETSLESYVPIKISNGKLDNVGFSAYSHYRNQIGEMAKLQEEDDGYRISIKIGTYSCLDLIQIIKPEKSNEVLDIGLNKFPLGSYNKKEEFEDILTFDETVNEYYLPEEEVTIESYNHEKDTGLISFHIPDLNTPLILRTYSAEGDYFAINQVLQISENDIFQFNEITETEDSFNALWMGYTGNTPTVNAELASRNGTVTNGSNLFDIGFDKDVTVKRTADGSIQVNIKVNTLEGNNKIQKIEIDKKHPTESKDDTLFLDFGDILNDYWAEYEEVPIQNGSITLTYTSFEDMAMGIALRVTTAETEEANIGMDEASQEYWFSSLYITPKKNENQQITVTDGDVKFTYWDNDFPEGSQFTADEVNRDFRDTQFKSYTTFAKDYRVYAFSVLDENGEEKDASQLVNIEVPIPEEWNLDRVYAITTDGVNIAPARPGDRLDRENRTFTLSSVSKNTLNGSLLLYDAGEAEDLSKLQKGIYQCKVTIANKSDPLQTSMANEAFSSTPAYLEIGENGKISLYAEVGGVNLGGQFGYVSNMFTGNIDQDDKQEVTYLAYQTENGEPIWETDLQTYSAHNIKRVCVELTNPLPEDSNYPYAYQVGFYVPIMDGMTGGTPGSGTGAQPAYLRVSDIEPASDGVNPLNTYDRSVAKVSLDNAIYYQKTEKLSEEKSLYVNNAIKQAEEEITKWEDDVEEDEILNVCHSLQTAMNSIALNEGRYQIPFLEESDLKDFENAVAVIEDGMMTISLRRTDSSRLPEIKYCLEYGEPYSDVIYSDDETTVTFTFPYTERSLVLILGEEICDMAMDFENAVLLSADMSALKNLLEEANEKLENKDKYTVNTVETLEIEIRKAETLLTDLDAEQVAVDSQVNLLRQSIDGLKEKASDDQLTELSQLKREIAAAINDETYTSASRAELKEFYDELTESTADTDNISTEDYEQYVLSIEAAMAALEEATDDPDDDPDHSSDNQVLSLVEDYRSWLDESDFTADSWAAFSEVLDAAEALSQNELTETEIQEEIDKILEARNGLIYQTNYEDQIEELAAYLDEVEADVESQGFPGYIGYDSLVSAIAAADYGVARNFYLSENQILALKDSVTFHYDALLEEDNIEEEAANSIMLLEDYIPEVILDEELVEAEEVPEELDAEKESAAEESESSSVTEESSSAAEESTGAAEESTTAAEESTSAEESTDAAEESSSATEESTEAVEESSSTAEESTSAAEESSDAEKETSGSAEESTGETEADSSADEETASPDKEDSAPSPEENREEKEPAQEEENISEDSLDSAEESEDVSASDSDEEDNSSEEEEVTEKEEKADKSDESSQALTVATISPHITYRVTAAASRSSDYEDGTYYVDYDLWKWDDDSLSMGNAALDYGDQLGRMILDDGTWTLYIHFNQLQYDGIVGELKERKRMVNIKQTSDGLDYDTRDAEYPEIIEDYPSVLGFTTSQSEEYIPVEVNVPLMTAGPIQVARLIVDWDSLDYINGSTDINSSMDLSKIEDAMDEAERLKEADYTSWSWQVVEDSLNAAEQMIRSEWATQAMIDTRAEALEAAIDALVPVAGSSDKLKLSDALLEAYIIDEADYSSNALLEIGRAREAAEALENADDVTAPMIETAIRELEEALSRSGTGSGEDSNDPDDSSSVRYTTLQSLIQLLEGYDSSQYTASSWKNLQTALESAKEVLESAKDGQATQDEVDDQVQLLKDARSELVLTSGGGNSNENLVNFKYLNSLISRAKTLLSMTSSYTEASLRNLQTEYDLALVMLDDEDVTQEDVDEQKENLRSAINSLVAASGTSTVDDTSDAEDDDTDDSGSNEDEGYYEVDVDLWHATLNKASMGDPAVNKTAYVHIDEDGDITMRLVTKKMTTSGITTHLYDFYYYEDGDYEEAELISSENSKWIFEFPLPNDNDKYYKCKVDPRVDVMGDDPVKARLKVDWDSLDEVDEDDWDNLEGDVDDDDDDTTSSTTSSTSSNPTLQSGETGIRIYGNVGGPGIVLEVVKKENGAEYDMTHGSISSLVNQFVLYDVKLKSGTGYVQPTSSVTMQIPIPTGYDTSKLVLYRIGEDGSYTTISGKVNGSYYEATVDHFSLYALAESNQVTETAASSGNDSSSSGSSSGGSSSRTRTTSSRTSSRTSSVQSNSSDTSGNHVAAGREIPYTGDPMPVKELAGVGFLAAVICLGTVLPDLRRKLESRKQQEE